MAVKTTIEVTCDICLDKFTVQSKEGINKVAYSEFVHDACSSCNRAFLALAIDLQIKAQERRQNDQENIS